jgi:hypothetical protein
MNQQLLQTSAPELSIKPNDLEILDILCHKNLIYKSAVVVVLVVVVQNVDAMLLQIQNHS